MKLPCPRCGLQQEIPVDAAGSGPRQQGCRGCGGRLEVRGLYTPDQTFGNLKVFCSVCGQHFPYAAACPFCRSAFKGFVRVALAGTLPEARQAPPRKGEIPPPAAAWRLSHRLTLVLTALLLLSVLAAGGGYYFHLQHARRVFVSNSVLVLYGLKSGFERGKTLGAAYLAEAGGGVPAASLRERHGEELADLDTIRREVERLMAGLNDPPLQLRDFAARIRALHAASLRQEALLRDPGGAADGLQGELEFRQQEFAELLEGIRGALPPLVREEVKNAGTRYDLRFLE